MSMAELWIAQKAFLVILCLAAGAVLLHFGPRVSMVITSETDVIQAKKCQSRFVVNSLCSNASCRHGETQVVEHDHVKYQFPPDIRPVLPWQNVSEIDPVYAQQLYFRYVDMIQVECQYRSRYGVWTDGGWEMCLAGPYMPERNNCLIYSFGINNEWSFDDSVSQRLGCTVKAFDPTMDNMQEEHMRGAQIHFYPYGLYSNDGNILMGETDRPVRTLNTLLQHAGDTGKIIDYLKIDIESSEWDSLSQILTTTVLQTHVKQIGLETHSSTDADKLQRHIEILEGLQRQGFRRWHSHLNIHVMYKLPNAEDRHYSYGQEVYYININFLPHAPV